MFIHRKPLPAFVGKGSSIATSGMDAEITPPLKITNEK